MSTTQTPLLPSGNTAPDVSSCVIQPTMDEQLNYNLGELVKMIIGAFQDGTVSPKNSDRLQNLTVDDIVDIVIKKLPNTNLTSYITQNGTTIVEMIDSYNIIKDTKFVNSDFLEFEVISRRENDPADPTGVTKIEVPYIRAKLPYDLVNKDRIVQIYLTTKNDDNQNTIDNHIIFEYYLDTDPIDPRAPYVMEARAAKINIGKTRVIDVDTNPLDPSKWGTWSDEKYIVVSYLVDTASWFSQPTEPLPAPENPYVSKVTSSKVTPMTWGGNGITPITNQPNESVIIPKIGTKIIDATSNNLVLKETVNHLNTPSWAIIEDPTEAKQWEEYIIWLTNAQRIIEQGNKSFSWTPDPTKIGLMESSSILIMPTNKIISQFTYNLTTRALINFGGRVGKDGLATAIIEMVKSNPMEVIATTKLLPYQTIIGNEPEYALFLKFQNGQQFPFFPIDIIRIPSWIANFITGNTVYESSTLVKMFPARIIEELKANLNPFKLSNSTSYFPVPTRIINFLKSLEIEFFNTSKANLNNAAKIILKDAPKVFNLDEAIDLFKDGSKIILENKIQTPMDGFVKNPLNKNLLIPARVITQSLDKNDHTKNVFTQWGENFEVEYLFNKYIIDYGKCVRYEPNWIINQQGLYPVKMEVNSGSIYYIQDKYNMKVISSLNKEEFIPLVTAEGKQQRSEYEFTAAQDQRVFDVQHNQDMVTVYRQGFKLSHGDYYSNGSKIILKAPANAGEVINIISERRYVFSNSVTKEELNNAINQMKTERPILTYPAAAFEKSTAEIKIENYDATFHYTIQVKYEGKYRDDVTWVKQKDRIILDVPEVVNASRRTLSVVVYAGTSGKLQSPPTEAIISVKNLFDSGTSTSKVVVGAIPTEWFGKENTNYTFDEMKTTKSIYGNLNELTSPYPVSKRIGIDPNNYFQSNVISVDKFEGSYIDAAIGLENIPARGLNIILTNGSETVFSSKRTQQEIEDAFEKGTLYFIVDSSTVPNSSNYQIPNTSNYDGNRFSYRPALEYTSALNLLPRSDKTTLNDATWYIEHNNNLRGRYIRAAMILDFDFRMDFDFNGQSVLDEVTESTKRSQHLEMIKYQVQDEVPHLIMTINDPAIPNITNPYINIGSKIEIPTNNVNINTLQTTEPLLVNNLYADRIFSGLHVNLKPKDNFTDTQLIFNRSKRYKKFTPFSPGALMGLYDSYYKKDFFMLSEDDVNLDPTKNIISMLRFFNDHSLISDNPEFSARVKELNEVPAVPNSFKGLFQIPSEPYSSGSDYQSNLAHIQYGGTEIYIDDTHTSRELIEQKYTYCKIYVRDTLQPQQLVSGKNPNDFTTAIDGFHTMVSTPKQIRIPSWFDVVLRPSVRPNRLNSLRDIWECIRTNVSMDDSRWLRITDGVLKKPTVVNDINLSGSILRAHEVASIPDRSQLFIFGGVGYKPTKVRKQDNTVTDNFIGSMEKDPTDPAWNWFLANLKYAYNKRGVDQYRTDSSGNQVPNGGWRFKTDILGFNYGWENGEPFVDFAWAEHFLWSDRYGTYDGLRFYIHRVSRVQEINKDIYHLDLSKADAYNPTDSQLYPDFITKIINTDYRTIYDNPSILLGPGSTETLTTPLADKVNFQDVTYEAPTGTWWMTIKPAYTNDTILFSFNTNYSMHASGSGISVSTFTWNKAKNLTEPYFLSTKPKESIRTRWSLLPDITGTLRGDGPILMKHQEILPIASSQTPTSDPGMYYFDTWDKNVYFKKLSDNYTMPTTSSFFGIAEITGVRNPYIIQLDPIYNIEDRIDIVGSRIFVVVYLDKFISKMTLADFNLFKEEILHIENGISAANLDKRIYILPNDVNIGIRTILPDGDDYHSTSAQILLNRTGTQTGRPASNLVFRITNKDTSLLEIENVRFQTTPTTLV